MKMKNVKSILLAASLALVLPFTKTFAQSGHHDAEGHEMHQEQAASPEFKDKKLETAYQHYLHLKTALVASDANEAKKGAEMLATSLKEVSNATEAQKVASKIAQTTSLDKQREAFITLSESMGDLVKGALSSGAIYKAYCPMVNNNQGAYWLSESKEIRNPYFGDKMLKCGSVKEELN
ncbi:DUF3347 domain-containing protein [Catalinimonas niigatensis]|uniref:DUF3347 domain-containing protein n=1 Tax=Catalinimonas niigatensis TaxID=1397264 RepID=UPI002666ED6A|nr:DUF3347 domain-containing protein [Catalinimonas niigatensis]WPP51875.1 DUF3347 domain-containing protein [Catalinimonas niigatensis]